MKKLNETSITHDGSTPTAVTAETESVLDADNQSATASLKALQAGEREPGPVPEDVTKYATRINDELGHGIQALVSVGQALVEAKAKLRHGQWQSLFACQLVHVDLRTAEKLMRIAGNEFLANSTNWSKLPPTLNALDALAAVPEKKLERAVLGGKVTPALTIADTRAVVARLVKKSRHGSDGAGEPTESSTDDLITAAVDRINSAMIRELKAFSEDASRKQMLTAVRDFVERELNRRHTDCEAANNSVHPAASAGDHASN